VLISGIMAYALMTRAPFTVSVIHDRNPIFVKLSDGHIRNVMVIAGRSVLSTNTTGSQLMSPDSVFSNVIGFGDSYLQLNNTPTGCYPAASLPAYLKKYGYHMGSLNDTSTAFLANVKSFTGRRLIGWTSSADSGGASGTVPVNAANPDKQSYSTSLSYLWNNFPALLATNPTCVILQCGANDWSGDNFAPTYARWLKYYLERFFGLNGNPATTIQAVVISTTPWPPYMQDGQSARYSKGAAGQYAAVQAAVAWFQATYPSLANYVTIADCYSALGGQNSYQQCFNPLGKVDLHPSPTGFGIMGQVWAQALLNLQSQINGTALLPSSITPISQRLAYFNYQPLSWLEERRR
jgi:hypothetical protein